MDLKAKVQVKKTLYGRIAFWIIPFCYRLGFLKEEQATRLINRYVLNHRSMKVRTSKGKWLFLDLREYEFEQVNK